MHPSYLPSFFLAALKWPLALISPLLLPFAVLELWRSDILLTVVASHQTFLLGSAALRLADGSSFFDVTFLERTSQHSSMNSLMPYLLG